MTPEALCQFLSDYEGTMRFLTDTNAPFIRRVRVSVVYKGISVSREQCLDPRDDGDPLRHALLVAYQLKIDINRLDAGLPLGGTPGPEGGG